MNFATCHIIDAVMGTLVTLIGRIAAAFDGHLGIQLLGHRGLIWISSISFECLNTALVTMLRARQVEKEIHNIRYTV